MGDWETRASALVESTLGYHPDSTGVLTGRHESGDWTLLGALRQRTGFFPGKSQGSPGFPPGKGPLPAGRTGPSLLHQLKEALKEYKGQYGITDKSLDDLFEFYL